MSLDYDWGYDDEDERDDGWTEAAVNVLDEKRRIRVLTERCTTCILGGAQSITSHLRSGRLKDLVEDASDGHIPCHSTLSNSDPHAAVCRGWYEAFGPQSNYIRVMERLGGIVEVEPRVGSGGSDA